MAEAATYCGYCGKELAGGGGGGRGEGASGVEGAGGPDVGVEGGGGAGRGPAVDHAACALRLRVIDPPRFCATCARRMVVQVTPAGWTATCSRHGEITSTGR